MKRFIPILITMFAFMTTLPLSAASEIPGIPLKSANKILLIGNSITDKWGPLHGNLTTLLSIVNPSVTIDAKIMGMGGGNLDQYIRGEAGDIMGEIRDGNYDYVFVQPYQDSYAPKVAPHTKESFFASCRTLHTAITSAGSRMVLWSVQGYQSDDRWEYLQIGPANCQEIAKELNCIYIMTCEAWEAIYRETNDPFLWADIIHQGAEGSALFAMMFYSVLMDGVNPVGLVDNWLSFVEGGQWVGTREFKHQDVMERAVQEFSQKSLEFMGQPVGVTSKGVSMSPNRHYPLSIKGNSVNMPSVKAGDHVEILNLSGKTVASFIHDGSSKHRLETPLANGTALFRIKSGRTTLAYPTPAMR